MSSAAGSLLHLLELDRNRCLFVIETSADLTRIASAFVTDGALLLPAPARGCAVMRPSRLLTPAPGRRTLRTGIKSVLGYSPAQWRDLW